jgi:TPR repeat protein
VLAQYYAGHHYASGIGTEQDESAAIRWYTRAAKQGHTYSRQLIENYSGEKIKPTTRMTPFEKHMDEALGGDAGAQFIMGRYHEEGIGVTKDSEKAKEWYSKAAEQGHAGAKNALNMLIKRMG